MKRSSFSITTYALFILLFVGSFASMARNSYGTDLIGFSCIGFAIIFLSDSLALVVTDRSKVNPLRMLENILLSALSVLFALRVFYIRFEGIELVVSAVGFVLAVIYILRRISMKLQGIKSYLATFFILAISLFFLSLAIAPIIASVSQIIGVLGFIFLAISIGLTLFKPKVTMEAESEDEEMKEASSLQYLFSLGRNSVVIAIAFILMSAYVGLTQLELVPELYTNAKPQKYIKLVKMAEAGEEEPINGRYSHEIYAREMEEFLEKHGE